MEDEIDQEFEEGYGIMLMLDPETRMWELKAKGTAAMLMFLMHDVSEFSLMNKLIDEAKFDQVIAGLGDFDVGTEG